MITVNAMREQYYQGKSTVQNPQRLFFTGVGDKDVYNITAPFEWRGETLLMGRVESRESEISQSMFFYETGQNVWSPKESMPVFDLQDPFITYIEDELVIGGVETFPKESEPTKLQWRTIFYKCDLLNNWTLLFTGPIGMKDIRLKQLADGRLLILTRPQGEKGGRGKIGYTVVNSVSDLSEEIIDKAQLLSNFFIDEEWGGANEIHLIDDSHVGILGHIANFDDEGNRHYYPISFILNIETGSYTHVSLLAERKDFLPGPAKRLDLQDVVFSGGLILQHDEAVLYVGISDADAQYITISNPFKNNKKQKGVEINED